MNHGTFHACAVACFCLALISPPATADEQADRNAAIAAATKQADQWLNAMDEHRYTDGWDESATVVKEGRTEQEWVREVSGPREALGKLVMRELKRTDFSTRVRGAPEGEYVTAVYLAKFTNIPLAVETVLLTRESGQWRIGGYSIGEAGPPAGPQSGDSATAPAPKAKD